ncbi:MAG: EAL domain-containing protein [Methylotenera sp.]|uniref:EAL domain-containing protein n=1 Tax=Methylotenera sp. TaxID=2051956 RepID=UPI002489DDBE|nr:EAL domain-containing protein [Methylotenera sp.]MDI1308655.1 EAL domain-containing protein [Methylotenera sp.]
MKNIGIKSRVIFLGTIPALLFAIILVGYAITNIFSVLDQSLQDRGKVIASQLAPAAEYGVISGNSQVLQRLAQQTLSNEQDLRTVMLVNSQGLILALSGRELPATLITKINQENLQQLPLDKGTIFTFPIYQSLVEIEDFSNLSSKELALKESYTPRKIGQVYVELSNQTLHNIKQDLIVKIFLTAMFGLVLSGLLAWKLGRHITKPIQEIANAVNRIGEGVFSQTIMEDSSGELKTLQKGFNSMSSSLKHAYDGMQEKINDATSMLRHQAQHDDLTGLINRREFEVRLERCLKSVHGHNAQHIFCFLDLDQFKLVNDTCGHSAGDELLKQVSILLANKMRDRDTLARLGGDEFGLLLENCTLADANQINNALLKTIRDYRFIHDDKIFNIGVSIGLVVINKGFENVSEIIHAADLACYSAKSAGRNQSFLFNPGDVEVVSRRSAVESISDITDEINDEQFMLYCQPIVPLISTTTLVQHYEILLRKIDLDGKIILPTTFIPSAERYHLMPNIDRWVIKNVFLAYQKLLEINSENCNYVFSINLSGTSLGDKSLLSFIQDMFVQYPIPPECICFEITETAAIVNLKNTILLFSALRKIGCSFALDDFGSGMSSFTYLKNFDVDYLKIDGTFVKEMHINKIDHAMVSSIHSVAEAMNIKTVAEFVENEEILRELKSIGVHYGQGLYLGAPVTVNGLIERAKMHAQ